MISDVYFPRINGVSTSIQIFRSELERLGCPTLLVAPEFEQSWDDDERTTRIGARPVPLDPEDRLMFPRELLTACRNLAGQFDLIHIHTPFVAHWIGVKLAKELGVKTVETYHTYFEEYLHHYAPFVPRWALRAFARRLSRAQCNSVDTVISPSRPMADLLRSYGATTPIEVLATGLDLEQFEGGDGRRFRAMHGISEDQPVLLHVGRVAFEKNIGFILDAFSDVRAQVPDALLVIASGLEDSVMFVGYLDREATLLDCYRSANAFVFASNTETQGLVLLEAMAVGTPVVSTAVLGTKDVLERGDTGAIVVPENRERFAQATVQLLGDRNLQRCLGKRGRRYVEQHWSSDVMARRLLELYESLTSTRAEHPPARSEIGVDRRTLPG
jgi:glycosyltransferase involved in cell wall biosynthesis